MDLLVDLLSTPTVHAFIYVPYGFQHQVSEHSTVAYWPIKCFTSNYQPIRSPLSLKVSQQKCLCANDITTQSNLLCCQVFVFCWWWNLQCSQPLTKRNVTLLHKIHQLSASYANQRHYQSKNMALEANFKLKL